MKKLLAILAVLLLGITNVFSQELANIDIDKYMRLGKDNYNNAKYHEAIDNFSKVVNSLEDNVNSSNFTHYLSSLSYIELCYNALEDYETAIDICLEISLIIKNVFGEKHTDYVKSMSNLATYYSKIGDNNTALELTDYILEVCIKDQGLTHPMYVDILSKKMYYNSVIRNHAEVIKIGEELLPIIGKTDKNYFWLLSSLIYSYTEVSKYTTAIELGIQALAIKNQVLKNSPIVYALLYTNLIDCYYSIGDYTSAIELGEDVLYNMKIAFDETAPIRLVLNKMSLCYYEVGNYYKAIELGEQLLQIEDLNHINYATSLGNLANYYAEVGDYNKALELHEQALVIRKEELGENHLDYITSLHNLATYYYAIKDYNKAIEYGQFVVSQRKNILGEQNVDYASSLANLAIYYNDYNKAVELGKKAADIYKAVLGENHPLYAKSLSNMAYFCKELGNYAKSIEYIKYALDIQDAKLDKAHPDYSNSLAILQDCFYKQNDFDKIKPIWNTVYKSVKTHTLSQFRGMTSAQRYMYWNTNIISNIVAPNNQYTKVLHNDNLSMGLSYNSLLFSKGVILASDIEFDKVIRESGDTVLLWKFEELRTTRAILNTYYNKPITERPEGEVERLEARAEVLEKDLLAGSKEYADFTRRLEIEWQDVQAALGDKDVAIEILAADEYIDEDTPPYYAALVLRKGWDAPKFVELCGAEVLKEYFADGKALALMYKEEDSKKLYNTIWGKLAEYINEGDNVYFSPAGFLYQINVELLQDAERRLANEKYNLHRVSSTRELCFEKPNIAHSAAVLYGGLTYDMDSTAMIAQSRAVRAEKEEFYVMRALEQDSLRGKLNHLPASEREVHNIGQQMKAHNIAVALYKKEVGNEESFKALSGKKTPILHLATHGFFLKNEEAKVKPFYQLMGVEQDRLRPDNSLRRSGLAFAGAQKAWDGEETPKGIDDGIMLAQEIASMDLNGTDLVVLSACETGLGEINSEGVFGLQRAFKKAGVQTLIMSLWKVHDEATALFMQTFYENLLSGKSKRDSFAAAQMALREHKQYGADPYYWAGFIMLD